MNADPTRGGAATTPPADPDETFDFDDHAVEAAPAPILDRLRASYQEAATNREGRRKTLLIVPGRYDSALAVRLMPLPYEEWRKKAKRAQKTLTTPEAEANFAASMIADATETILVRDDDGQLKPMHEVVDQFKGEEPVKWDGRLMMALGIEIPPEHASPKAIVRLVYNNPQALAKAFGELQGFLAEDASDDDGEEDDADRPT